MIEIENLRKAFKQNVTGPRWLWTRPGRRETISVGAVENLSLSVLSWPFHEERSSFLLVVYRTTAPRGLVSGGELPRPDQ